MTDETNGALVAQEQQPKRAIAKARLEADGAGVMAIMPRDLESAQRYATGLIQADQVPDAFRVGGKKGEPANAPLVLMAVLKSLELGMPPQTGLAALMPINGRFVIYGDGAWAMVQRGGQLDRHTTEWHWPETFDKHNFPLEKWPAEIGCTVRMWRRGQTDPYVGIFTVGDARRAGLWLKFGPWKLYPERMLFNRARAFAMRDGFADSLFGLGIAEEVMDYAPAKQKQIDNSALDDDLPSAPMLDAPKSDLKSGAENYRSGLAMIDSLEALQAYQEKAENVRLIAALQKSDEAAYNFVIMANARRYQELEEQEREAERERSEAQGRVDDDHGETTSLESAMAEIDACETVIDINSRRAALLPLLNDDDQTVFADHCSGRIIALKGGGNV